MRITLAYLLVIAATASAALGPDLVRNGDFFVNEQWQAGTGWTITGGKALFTSPAGIRGSLIQPLSLEPGADCEVRYTISDLDIVGMGYVQAYLGETAGDIRMLDGDYVETITAGAGFIEIWAAMNEGSTCKIDNVSVRRIVESELATDFDKDGAVNANDLTVFAAGWLSAEPNTPGDLDDDGNVNLVDFALFAADWGLGTINAPPVATDQAVQVTVGDAVNITLAASDANGDYLSYKINQPPTMGTLTRLITGLYRYRPYLESSGLDTFKWQCSDGKTASNEATVSITVLPEVLDNLRYDGPAMIEIADGNNIDIDDNFMLTCWFRTEWPEGVLWSKRADSGGPGFVAEIRGGHIVNRLFDQDGTEYCYVMDQVRVDDGVWWFWGLDINIDPNDEYPLEISVSEKIDLERGYREDTRWLDVRGVDLSNDAPLRVGCYRNRMFYGAIDYITNKQTSGGKLSYAPTLIETRKGVLNPVSPVYYRRFLIDEGDGDTITDTVGGVTGTLSNHGRIKWSTPDAAMDSRGRQRSRLRGVEGATMLPDFRKRN